MSECEFSHLYQLSIASLPDYHKHSDLLFCGSGGQKSRCQADCIPSGSLGVNPFRCLSQLPELPVSLACIPSLCHSSLCSHHDISFYGSDPPNPSLKDIGIILGSTSIHHLITAVKVPFALQRNSHKFQGSGLGPLCWGRGCFPITT